MKRHGWLMYHGFPIATIIFPFLWVAVVGDERLLKGEAGIVENLTVVYLFLAIGFCVASLRATRRLTLSGFLKSWLFILVLGSGYFALEELSYGQHLFGWGTAETWKELNDQDETNLHNVHAIFDQVPRALLTLGILVGGVLYPLYRQWRKITLDESNPLYWQWPTVDCVTIGLLVILVRPIFSLYETDMIDTGEFKENLFALFILLYCVSIHTRLKSKLTTEPIAET